VLSRRTSYEFKELFDIVHENLRARNAASEARKCFGCVLTKNSRTWLRAAQ